MLRKLRSAQETILDPRCAGVFITDGANVFLGHTGRLGGLKRGAKAAFLESSNAVEATLPDGGIVPVVVIGDLGDSALLHDLRHFVRRVSSFKLSYRSVAIEDQLDQNAEEADDQGVFDFANAADERTKCLRSITLRRGQMDFRKKLLTAYQERCAVTSCDCVTVLEAAHIKPYGGEETNHVQNGLLLRSDIHVLHPVTERIQARGGHLRAPTIRGTR